jgi:hypothetical protein
MWSERPAALLGFIDCNGRRVTSKSYQDLPNGFRDERDGSLTSWAAVLAASNADVVGKLKRWKNQPHTGTRRYIDVAGRDYRLSFWKHHSGTISVRKCY